MKKSHPTSEHLRRWQLLARRHWEEFQPKRYAALVASGHLDGELLAAAQMTLREMVAREEQGSSSDEAWQSVRGLYLFPAGEPEIDGEPQPLLPAWESLTDLQAALREDE